MKVTKVDRTRIAIGKIQENETGVIFYKNPDKENKGAQGVREVVKNRVDDAKGLYNVFFQEKLNQFRKDFNNLIEKLVSEPSVRNAYTQETAKNRSQNRKKAKLKQVEMLKNWKNQKVYKFEKTKLETVLASNMKVMRKSLKRGTDYHVAMELMRGLACGTLVQTVGKLDEGELLHFLDSVNRDYYKPNVEKSLKGMETKVQSRKGEIALTGATNKTILKVTNKQINKRKVINRTLKRYASSPSEAENVLKEIKGILLEYFLPQEDNSEYLKDEKLWKMPKRIEGYFDEEFEQDVEQNGTKDSLSTLCEEAKENQKKISKRIRYVNYGKYQNAVQNIKDELDKDEYDFQLFWINYIKEYVEKHYVETEKVLRKAQCLATDMMYECWKDIIRYLCGKYIELGKGIYHFTEMPKTNGQESVVYGSVKEQYKNGITSFDYETITAEDNLKRDISVYLVAALAAFSRAVIDDTKREEKRRENSDNGMEDILFLDENVLRGIKKENGLSKKQLLRFYGGASTFDDVDGIDEDKLIDEIKYYLASIRNENFHFAKGKQKYQETPITKSILFENDKKAYGDLVKQRYLANNVFLFYETANIVDTIKKLYAEEHIVAAQVPAFRKVWKRDTIDKFITTTDKGEVTGKNKTIYEGALYFLLKEIYYRDFAVSEDAVEKFFKAVKTYNEQKQKGTDKEEIKGAANNFTKYVKKLKEQNYSFGQVCQFIVQEYNQQNTKSGEKKIYQHFKMIFPICVKMAFCEYIKEKYDFISKPKWQLEQISDLKVEIGICNTKDFDKMSGAWYTLAHFLHPRQLNHLVGDIKNYIQYKGDIIRREQYAGQESNHEEDKAAIEGTEEILMTLEFVRCVAGRISNQYEDYYESQEEYAQYLAQYIDYPQLNGKTQFESLREFCMPEKAGQPDFDIYVDAKNPKILRNVEIARMYAGGDSALQGYPKITRQEIEEYYREKDTIDESNRIKMAEWQKKKNRITLNEVTDIFSLLNDLLGKLVSLSYLKERDEMYLLLGFYSMAMNEEENWGEQLNQLDQDQDHVSGGLVLKQICAIFDFGLKLLYEDGRGGGIGGSLTVKINKFELKHKESWKTALQLFEDEQHLKALGDIRNYVDHMKYYTTPSRSIISLYNVYYTNMFAYNSKLRKSVIFNFKSILEKYFILAEVEFGDNRKFTLKNLRSTEFTYKLSQPEKGAKDNKVEARTKGFLNSVQQVLNYPV